MSILAIKDWNFRKRISLLPPTADLTGFPVKVPIIADAEIGAGCLATGYDIRFTEDDGITELPYERESWAGGGGVPVDAIFWVKKNVSTAGTYIWCYYGNAAATDGENAEAVWDANFKAVYHMKDATTSTILDSTANNNDGAKGAANKPLEIDGKIGKGQTFDSYDDAILYSAPPLLDFSAITFSAWIYPTEVTSFQYVLDCLWGAPGRYVGYFVGGKFYFELANDAGTSVNVSVDASAGAWQYIVVKWDGANITITNNGTPGTTVAVGGVCSGNAATRLGNVAGSALDGILDEVRISSIARSAEWIAYEYANMNPADGGLTWGAEDPDPGRPIYPSGRKSSPMAHMQIHGVGRRSRR